MLQSEDDEMTRTEKSGTDPQPPAGKKGGNTGVQGKDQNEEEVEEVEAEAEAEAVIPSPQSGPGTNASSTDKNDRLPKAFFCPISNKLLSDPVVAEDGVTYERSSFLKHPPNRSTEGESLYPNRALQVIIEETILLQDGNSIQAGLKRLQYSAEAAVSQLVDVSGLDGFEEAPPICDGFYCPITFNIFHEPVIDPDGNTYERVAVETWIRLNGTSPVTRRTLSVDRLYPNIVLRRLLDEMGNKPSDEIHPAIRKWKEEAPPKATDVEFGGGLPSPTLSNNATSYGIQTFPTNQMERNRRRLSRIRTLNNLMGCISGAVCLAGLVLLGRSFFLVLLMFILIMLFADKRPVR